MASSKGINISGHYVFDKCYWYAFSYMYFEF